MPVPSIAGTQHDPAPRPDTSARGTRATPPTALNLHLHQLAYLLAVARTGGVTRAAEVSHVSQPALSQALAELERRLGVPLLERAGRGRRLTPAGQEVAAFAERVLADAAGLERTLVAYSSGDGGVLRVGMIDAASIYLLPEAIRAFRAAYPAVDLRITVETSGELLRRLRAADLDLAFVVGAAGQPDLRSTEIAREPLFWYAPAGDSRPIEEAGWALYPAGSRTRRLIDDGFARLGIRPRITLESAHPEVLRQVTVMDLGWTVLPPTVADASPAGSVRQGDRVTERPIDAVVRRTAAPDARVERFLALAVS